MDQRNEPVCPHAKACGGCRWQGTPYARQLELKEAQVRRLMGRFCRVEPIWGMENPYHYRNKVQAAFGTDRRGNIISGVYQSGSHRIVTTEDCLLEDETADRIIVDIRRMMPKFKMTAYDEKRRSGFLRHVLVKRGFATNEVMVVLVASTPVFQAQKPFTAALLELHPEITTLLLNVNDRFTSLVLGEREKLLYGKGYIQDELCGYRFRVSARSFYQVNPVQTEKLYSAAIDCAGLTGSERVLDAYCGAGTIGICASSKAGHVIGVEQNADAVRDAIANAKGNGVRNCRFIRGDAGRFMEELADDGERCEVVFMDPPRAGSDARFLFSLLEMGPERIVYVSCNPETLARDVGILTHGPYRVRRVQPVDMFPHTEHVETVVLLSKLCPPERRIPITLETSELDLTAAEAKATYEEIKEYVLEHYGFKVSHLYVAQVKRKNGVIERQNYNLPKTEGNHVPECPPEKEKAIEDALRHFKMI